MREVCQYVILALRVYNGAQKYDASVCFPGICMTGPTVTTSGD